MRGDTCAPFALMSRTALVNLLGGLLIGLALGLGYACVISPVQYTDVPPASLRADYKSDYGLMIAQAYARDHNLPLARARLATLALNEPGRFVATLAAQLDIAAADKRVLDELAAALGSAPLTPAP